MKDLDKYVDYATSQLITGYHTKEDVIDDLRERGLNDEEISLVIEIAWNRCNNIEKQTKIEYLLRYFLVVLIPVLIVVFYIVIYNAIPLKHLITIITASVILIYYLRRNKFNK